MVERHDNAIPHDDAVRYKGCGCINRRFHDAEWSYHVGVVHRDVRNKCA